MKKYFTVMYYVYCVLTAISGIAMLGSMFIGPPEMRKLFSLTFLWCAVGIFVNGKTFIKWAKKIAG